MLETIENYAMKNNCEKIEAVNHALNKGLTVFWYKGVVEREQILHADKINWDLPYSYVYVVFSSCTI